MIIFNDSITVSFLAVGKCQGLYRGIPGVSLVFSPAKKEKDKKTKTKQSMPRQLNS